MRGRVTETMDAVGRGQHVDIEIILNFEVFPICKSGVVSNVNT